MAPEVRGLVVRGDGEQLLGQGCRHAVVALDERVPTSAQRVERRPPCLGRQMLRAAGVVGSGARTACAARSATQSRPRAGDARARSARGRRPRRARPHWAGRGRSSDAPRARSIQSHGLRAPRSSSKAALAAPSAAGASHRRGSTLRSARSRQRSSAKAWSFNSTARRRDLDGQLGPGRRAGLPRRRRSRPARGVRRDQASVGATSRSSRSASSRAGETAEAPVLERLAQLRDVVAGGPFEALREGPVELASRLRDGAARRRLPGGGRGRPVGPPSRFDHQASVGEAARCIGRSLGAASRGDRRGPRAPTGRPTTAIAPSISPASSVRPRSRVATTSRARRSVPEASACNQNGDPAARRQTSVASADGRSGAASAKQAEPGILDRVVGA